MTHKYANSFVPRYGVSDEDYTPWIITHDDPKQLEPDVVEGHLKRWLDLNPRDPGDGDLLEDFYSYLSDLGYGTYIMPAEGIILERLKLMTTIEFTTPDQKYNGRPVATFDGQQKKDWVKVIYLNGGKSKLVWDSQMQRYDLKTILAGTKNYVKVGEYTLGRELANYLSENDPWCYVQDTYYGHKMFHDVIYIFPKRRTEMPLEIIPTTEL